MNKHTLAKLALENSQVLALLAQFTPEVVSTIFVDLDTRESDIDIVCCSQDLQSFAVHFTSCFSQKDGFRLKQTGDYCVGRFVQNSFDIEVYTSSVPVVMQAAYCHYQVMLRLCRLGGNAFKVAIRQLKLAGLKTEPAICNALGLEGDAYDTVYHMHTWPDEKLTALLQDAKILRNR